MRTDQTQLAYAQNSYRASLYCCRHQVIYGFALATTPPGLKKTSWFCHCIVLRLSTNGQAGVTKSSAYAKTSEKNYTHQTFVLSSFISLFDPFEQTFDSTRSQRSFVHFITMSLIFRVPAAFVPRGYKPARRGVRRLSPARNCIRIHEREVETG